MTVLGHFIYCLLAGFQGFWLLAFSGSLLVVEGNGREIEVWWGSLRWGMLEDITCSATLPDNTSSNVGDRETLAKKWMSLDGCRIGLELKVEELVFRIDLMFIYNK